MDKKFFNFILSMPKSNEIFPVYSPLICTLVALLLRKLASLLFPFPWTPFIFGSTTVLSLVSGNSIFVSVLWWWGSGLVFPGSTYCWETNWARWWPFSTGPPSDLWSKVTCCCSSFSRDSAAQSSLANAGLSIPFSVDISRYASPETAGPSRDHRSPGIDSHASRFCRMEKFVEIRIEKIEDLVWNFESILSWLLIEEEENRESFGNLDSRINSVY